MIFLVTSCFVEIIRVSNHFVVVLAGKGGPEPIGLFPFKYIIFSLLDCIGEKNSGASPFPSSVS